MKSLARALFYLAAFSVPAHSGDVVGKITAGYQGWFACEGDHSPANRWIHWGGSQPSPGRLSFEIWPDTREYEHTYRTGFANLGNGEPAKLFSSYDDQVVQTHFRWMREYGIDTAALQRFGSVLKDEKLKGQRDGMLRKVRVAAEANARKFYVMYDLSGWSDFRSAIKQDWTTTIVDTLRATDSPAYARENGKPVVCIWGMGFPGRPDDSEAWQDVITWFQKQGCYVIGGVPIDWRTRTSDLSAYEACDMITPWTVGAYKTSEDVENHRSRLAADLAFCEADHIDYQPVVFPGFAWSNWNGGSRNVFPRRHGDFLWEQFVNLRQLGIRTAYIAMFDEFDEGTAIAKAAEDASMIPTNQYFLTLDADDVHCSSDFYLRLAGDGARMIQGRAPLTLEHPTPHTP